MDQNSSFGDIWDILSQEDLEEIAFDYYFTGNNSQIQNSFNSSIELIDQEMYENNSLFASSNESYDSFLEIVTENNDLNTTMILEEFFITSQDLFTNSQSNESNSSKSENEES